jgi:hypothetical protein
MRNPKQQLNLLVSAMLAYGTSVVLLGGPRVEAAFGAGVIIGAGVVLSLLLGG